MAAAHWSASGAPVRGEVRAYYLLTYLLAYLLAIVCTHERANLDQLQEKGMDVGSKVALTYLRLKMKEPYLLSPRRMLRTSDSVIKI